MGGATAEVLVIGGGLAGAAAATHLARAGRPVLLLEREAGPHDKVCGEFLSFEAQAELALLGIDPAALGAHAIDRVALARGARRVGTPLRFRASSVSRRVLDEAVLDHAAAAGVEVRRGIRATTLARDGDAWQVGIDDGQTLPAREVMLATGKHDLRGWRRPQGRQPDLLGFKMYWRLPPGPSTLEATVELHLFPGGYAGLEMVEGRRANLCLVVHQPAFAAMGGRWDGLLAHILAACPQLALCLEGATPDLPRPLAIAAIPYGLVERRSGGVWRLGDQAAVIPSFTGEGMSLALTSARLAAEALIAGTGPAAFQRRLAARLGGQVGRSTLASLSLVSPRWQPLIASALTPGLMRLALRATRMRSIPGEV